MYAETQYSSVVVAAHTTLGSRRPTLWRDAAVIAGDHPLIGVGPGGFEMNSPLAKAEEDARFVPNFVLELAAETGIFGALLFIAAIGWVFVRLATGSARPAAAAAGIAALTAFGIQTSMDYVLHFPVVPAAAFLVIGASVDRKGHRS
jgi:O-antigen ligase